MTIHVSEQQFARIAKALRYPAFQKTTITVGYLYSTDQLSWALAGKLQNLTQDAFQQALDLADDINTKERLMFDSVHSEAPDVTKVGEIEKDSDKGYNLRRRALSDQRQRLAELVDHYVYGAYGTPPGVASSGGGISGTWSH